jgi:hypothetical protein
MDEEPPAPRRYTYAVEKLTDALRVLATGKGDARDRVANAYLCCITLTENDFPEELRGDWKWIAHEVTKFGPYITPLGEIFIGSVENTMRKRRSATAAKIAQRMWRLYWAMSRNTAYE